MLGRDANLKLRPDSKVLELTTTRSDLNSQVGLDQGEYLGFRLADLGFTGSEDFTISAEFPNIPGLAVVGQFGLYAGSRSDRAIRGGVLRQAEDNRAMSSAQSENRSNALNSALANAYERALQSYMFADGQPEFAFRVIDPPTIPDARERVWPQRPLFIALGFILGAILVIPAIHLRDFWRGRAGRRANPSDGVLAKRAQAAT